MHDISKMYWARYVLVDQALHSGGMRSTECLSSFLSDSSPLRDRAKLIYSMISQKVVDGFRRNLVDTLVVSQGRIDSILVKIQIRIWIRELFNCQSDSSPLRDSAKNDYIG